MIFGRVAHYGPVEHYNAADAHLLPAEQEGGPNVVFEFVACDVTPFVAKRAGGFQRSSARRSRRTRTRAECCGVD
jgi:glycosyltransferase involved in cell wall biosynthesis